MGCINLATISVDTWGLPQALSGDTKDLIA